MSRRERRRITALRAALTQLPEKQRAVFDAVAVEGASYTEAAERLCISVAEVEQQFAAALVSLDKTLKDPPNHPRWQRPSRRFVPSEGD